MERLNFIPQHGTLMNPLTSRSSPLRNEPSRTPTNPQSPLSPHPAMKGHHVPGLAYPGEGMIQDRRPSRSPHVASPGSDHRSFTNFPGVSIPLDVRQPSPLAHVSSSIRHPAVSKGSLSMPEGMTTQEVLRAFGGSNPYLLQPTSTLSSQAGRAKMIKQERSMEQPDSRDLPHRYQPSPDQLAHAYASHPSTDPMRSTQRWESHRQTGSPMDASQKYAY